MKKKILITALATILLGSSLSVYAAPQYMDDGAIFDAEWYLEQNPDVATAFPANVSPETLYQHYLMFGMKEGRTPYNTATFDPNNVLPNTGPTTIPTPVAPSNLTPTTSNNQNAQNYRWYNNYNWNWAQTVKSYLYENPDGGVTRVEYIDDKIIVEDYDSHLYLRSNRTIPMELSLWGGFFAGEKYNFFIFGQENPSQNNDTEVIRVVKYSKDWKRLGQTSLRGANTTIPFDAGSLRCAEYGDYLYIRTCHEMYASSRDGKNHQANLTLTVRQSDMRLTDTYYIVMNNSVGYVSHSFNQFVLIDQERNIVTLDHGDAYPRSIVLMRYNNTKAGEDKFSGSVTSSSLLTFAGTVGDNNTGASIGGFAETTNGYVTALNYDTTNTGMRDIYISYTTKNGLNSTLTGVTSLTGMFTPVLAPTGLDGGYLMWTDVNGAFYYTRYADGGVVGTISTADAALSDCQPICYNGEVLWYVTSNTSPIFYKIDAAGMLSRIPANGQ
ncbi:MAG: hypothetical protein OSJ73_13700 [Lachnospiraceae bacterium]|nr:hypothetical protein [Lachnospiraceae bacterium]HBV82950.1 hypothetical protein [Lachnospiraceae bacterium]